MSGRPRRPPRRARKLRWKELGHASPRAYRLELEARRAAQARVLEPLLSALASARETIQKLGEIAAGAMKKTSEGGGHAR